MLDDEDPAVAAARAEMRYFEELLDEEGLVSAMKTYYGELFFGGTRGGE